MAGSTLPTTDADEQTKQRRRRTLGAALWVAQALPALLFLFAGAMKFVMPVEVMTKGNPFPGWFFRFIGAAEVLGGLGLVLPGLTRIAPYLTPLAAAGLTLIMAGATVLSAMTMGAAAGVFPLVVMLLCAAVAYGRWRLAPHRGR
jgi:uncharacterized membrane protein YphA (DoxX/SURF4 family)